MEFVANELIILASQSPRRKELLGKLGISFQSLTSDVVEKFEAKPTDVRDYVTDLAIKKANAIAKIDGQATIIGADTIVSLNGKIFPKPENAEEAKKFLRTLSGKDHQVFTAVAIVRDGKTHTFVSETNVTFFELNDEIIDAYVQTGDCLDKAGAYGIQSGGMFFVEKINGDYYSVMGLPVATLSRTLLQLGAISLRGCEMNE